MLVMVTGHTEEIDASLAARELLDACAVGLDGVPADAGILFASHDVDLEDLVARIRAEHPDIELIGCTVVAPVSSAAPYTEGASTLTLFASDVIDFTAGLGRDLAADFEAAVSGAVRGATESTDKAPALAIMTPSVEGIDPVVMGTALGRALGESVPIFGGGAVPDYPMTGGWLGSRQVFGDAVVTDSLPLLLLSGPLLVSVGVRHGWKPVGRETVVTRSTDNKVFELGGEPIVDFYRHYIGPDLGPAISNPLAIHDAESDRTFLRAPLEWDLEEGSATFFGSVPEGSIVRVTMASTEEILDGGRASVADAMAGFPGGGHPVGALVSACAVRNILLGTRTTTEVENLQAGFGPDLPIAGFYAFGEFAPLGTAQPLRFHNETCVALVIGT